MIFTPTSGTLAGNTFLVIDANGVAGYQPGADFVIQLTNVVNLTNLSTWNFLLHS